MPGGVGTPKATLVSSYRGTVTLPGSIDVALGSVSGPRWQSSRRHPNGTDTNQFPFSSTEKEKRAFLQGRRLGIPERYSRTAFNFHGWSRNSAPPLCRCRPTHKHSFCSLTWGNQGTRTACVCLARRKGLLGPQPSRAWRFDRNDSRGSAKWRREKGLCVGGCARQVRQCHRRSGRDSAFGHRKRRFPDLIFPLGLLPNLHRRFASGASVTILSCALRKCAAL